MYTISTTIEIAASPTTVREKFLDFPSIPKYTPIGFVRAITPADPTKPPASLIPGDNLNCVMGYGKMKFSPVVVENSPAGFGWRGSVPGLFTGVHMFRFEAVSDASTGAVRGGEEEGGRTKLIHEENFTGLLAGVMGEGYLAGMLGMRESSRKGFDGFNEDFKAWVEQAK
ncbi:hypothetical protein BDW59DRAFT_160966 [Aspergillus cavernicola]|uniref:Uncharacterized protein n=1 Tax=Aspergillus cavernicola TaxID=176166 RepID=A0ABR4IF97_9EURO